MSAGDAKGVVVVNDDQGDENPSCVIDPSHKAPWCVTVRHIPVVPVVEDNDIQHEQHIKAGKRIGTDSANAVVYEVELKTTQNPPQPFRAAMKILPYFDDWSASQNAAEVQFATQLSEQVAVGKTCYFLRVFGSRQGVKVTDYPDQSDAKIGAYYFAACKRLQQMCAEWTSVRIGKKHIQLQHNDYDKQVLNGLLSRLLEAVEKHQTLATEADRQKWVTALPESRFMRQTILANLQLFWQAKSIRWETPLDWMYTADVLYSELGWGTYGTWLDGLLQFTVAKPENKTTDIIALQKYIACWLRITRHVIKGVCYLIQQGLSHNDLHVDNVMLVPKPDALKSSQEIGWSWFSQHLHAWVPVIHDFGEMIRIPVSKRPMIWSDLLYWFMSMQNKFRRTAFGPDYRRAKEEDDQYPLMVLINTSLHMCRQNKTKAQDLFHLWKVEAADFAHLGPVANHQASQDLKKKYFAAV